MIESERDLFVHTLRELYRVERDLETIQADLAEAATRTELEEFYLARGETTTDQLDRLEAIFDAIDAEVEPGALDSAAVEGLRADREALIGDVTDPMLGDLVEAELGRALERLEVTKLETLLTLAGRMDLPGEVVGPLERTRDETAEGLDRLRQLTR